MPREVNRFFARAAPFPKTISLPRKHVTHRPDTRPDRQGPAKQTRLCKPLPLRRFPPSQHSAPNTGPPPRRCPSPSHRPLTVLLTVSHRLPQALTDPDSTSARRQIRTHPSARSSAALVTPAQHSESDSGCPPLAAGTAPAEPRPAVLILDNGGRRAASGERTGGGAGRVGTVRAAKANGAPASAEARPAAPNR